MPDDPRIENLPWVADGITDSIEDDARTNLYGLVDSYSGLLDIVISKSWVDTDDIQTGSPTGASMIEWPPNKSLAIAS